MLCDLCAASPTTTTDLHREPSQLASPSQNQPQPPPPSLFFTLISHSPKPSSCAVSAVAASTLVLIPLSLLHQNPNRVTSIIAYAPLHRSSTLVKIEFELDFRFVCWRGRDWSYLSLNDIIWFWVMVVRFALVQTGFVWGLVLV
ncbi:unnamed protein product [Sphenostylis stenocarpa]|uniref:Uncharacterized protein n=1 Tax=Sphenostylis stenocarpa TaxID=92480 RepID=A0AA86W1Y8_9FABA|nr:unnamed protein product [Sphenostylis stenocarpa]